MTDVERWARRAGGQTRALRRAMCVTVLLIAAAACGDSTAEPPVVELRWPRPQAEVDGTVTLVEIGSVGCRVCRKFAVHALPILDSVYVRRGLLNFQYVELPLSDTAFADSVTALHQCIASTETTAAVHGQLIRQLQVQSPSSLLKDMDRETVACFTAEFQGEVESGWSAAVAMLGVQATPSFVIGRHHEDGRVVGWLVTGLPRFRFLQDLIARAHSVVATPE